MKIITRFRQRLSRAWAAFREKPIRITVSMMGPKQRRGYKQRWVFQVYGPENFKIITAADQRIADPAPQMGPRTQSQIDAIEEFDSAIALEEQQFLDMSNMLQEDFREEPHFQTIEEPPIREPPAMGMIEELLEGPPTEGTE